MKFVIRGKDGFAFTSTEIEKVGTEVQYDSFEEAENALEQFKLTMPFLNLDIIVIVPHGGKREGAGRPSLGTTKKVSLTLPDEVWENIDEDKEQEGVSQSAVLRSIVERYYNPTTDTADPEEKEHRFAEFKDFAFNTEPNKLIFHISKNGLFIATSVEKVEPYYDDAGIKFSFNGGNFHIWAENKISKCSRPGNLLIDCETCYYLYNEDEEPIGYIFTKKESAE
jgi:hypothetical protein